LFIPINLVFKDEDNSPTATYGYIPLHSVLKDEDSVLKDTTAAYAYIPMRSVFKGREDSPTATNPYDHLPNVGSKGEDYDAYGLHQLFGSQMPTHKHQNQSNTAYSEQTQTDNSPFCDSTTQLADQPIGEKDKTPIVNCSDHKLSDHKQKSLMYESIPGPADSCSQQYQQVPLTDNPSYYPFSKLAAQSASQSIGKKDNGRVHKQESFVYASIPRPADQPDSYSQQYQQIPQTDNPSYSFYELAAQSASQSTGEKDKASSDYCNYGRVHKQESYLYASIPGPADQPDSYSQQYQQIPQTNDASYSGSAAQSASQSIGEKDETSSDYCSYHKLSDHKHESYLYATIPGPPDQPEQQYQHTPNYNQDEHNPHNLEVGSKILYGNPLCSGVIKWMGHPRGLNCLHAGIEMVCS